MIVLFSFSSVLDLSDCLQYRCLMRCDVTGTVQFTFASRLLLIDLFSNILKMNFRVNLFSLKRKKKTAMTLDHCLTR